METGKRTFLKAVTWQTLGLLTMTALGFLATGSLTIAGSLALAGAATGVVSYILHERIWNRIAWGRIDIGRRP
jgi:uncharacterized membrane protein